MFHRQKNIIPVPPAYLIPLTLVISLGLLLFAHFLLNKDVVFIIRLSIPGYDYHFFYEAAKKVFAGGNPYDVEGFVTPPLTALLNIPLTFLPYPIASLGFRLLIVVSAYIAFVAAARFMEYRSGDETQTILLSGLLICFVSYPFYMLVERGNIDSFVALTLITGLLLCAQKSILSEVAAGLLFALSVHLKIYPILIFIPLLFGKKWRVIFFLTIFLLFFTFLTRQYWGEFQQAILVRSSGFRITLNTSVVNAFFPFLVFLQMVFLKLGIQLKLISLAPVFAIGLFYAPLLAMMIYADFRWGGQAAKEDFPVTSLLYIPFMLAIPQTTYPYTLVMALLLVPMVCRLWGEITDRTRLPLVLLLSGIVISQVQSYLLFNVTQNVLAHFLLAFGVMLMLIGATGYKIRKYDVWKRIRNSA